ncbi:MAG: LysM peptidoglycan-binding domain-containing protein [Verrucomicrobiae bacterium]|nr:LysM peptidoglycan-binding domain-containing protein [Verrucomicrobiae bacterium]
MSKAYLVTPAALATAMLLLWTGCASNQQPQSATGDGGTNLAYMAEGAPLITSTGGAAPSTAAGTMPSATPTAPQESFLYTVQPGDSLWKIANKHATSVSLIQKMNNMPPDKITIRVGDKLTIPGKADADRLRQQPSAPTTGASTVPTVTVPTASARVTAPTLTAPTVTTPAVSRTTVTPPTVTAPTVTAPTVTAPSATAPAASGGASWLPPSYRTPQAGSATAPGASATTPSLSIAPGSATLSPGAVNMTPSSPPPASLTLTPGTVTTPVGGMTIQAVGPSGIAPTTPPATTTPSPNP